MVFGPEEDFAHPLGGVMSFFTMPTPIDLEGWFHMHAMPGAVALGLRPDRDPKTCKAVLTIRTPERPSRDPEVQKAFIAKQLRGRTWQSAAVLAALEAADDFYFDALEQIHMPSFTRGRIALLGDAAYCGSPLTGHGTALALVGAYVLAGELAVHRADHGTALARYEQTMRPFIDRGHRLPPGGLKSMTPQSAFGIRIGTMMTRAMTSPVLKPLMMRMAKAPADELLPEYDLPEAHVRH
jgi:2-polyprenyl-6-methoxyphenol hydroxylase-like FAD-dependent oxidoreductase